MSSTLKDDKFRSPLSCQWWLRAGANPLEDDMKFYNLKFSKINNLIKEQLEKIKITKECVKLLNKKIEHRLYAIEKLLEIKNLIKRNTP